MNNRKFRKLVIGNKMKKLATTFKQHLSESETKLPHWPKTQDEATELVRRLAVDRETGEVLLPGRFTVKGDMSIDFQDGDVNILPHMFVDGKMPFKVNRCYAFNIVFSGLGPRGGEISADAQKLNSYAGFPDECAKVLIDPNILDASLNDFSFLENTDVEIVVQVEEQSHKMSSKGLDSIKRNNVCFHLHELSDLQHCPRSVSYFNITYPDFTEEDFKLVPNYYIKGVGTQAGSGLGVRNAKKLKSLKDIHKYIKHSGDIYFPDSKIESHALGILLIDGVKYFDVKYDLPENGEDAWFDIVNDYIHSHEGKNASEFLFECQQKLIDAGFKEFAQL